MLLAIAFFVATDPCHDHVRALDFPAATASCRAAADDPDATPAARVDALRDLGTSLVALNEDDLAADAFLAMLVLDDTAVLAADAGPPIRAAFDAARKRLAPVHARAVVADDNTLTVVLVDPLHRVAAVRAVRAGSTTAVAPAAAAAARAAVTAARTVAPAGDGGPSVVELVAASASTFTGALPPAAATWRIELVGPTGHVVGSADDLAVTTTTVAPVAAATTTAAAPTKTAGVVAIGAGAVVAVASAVVGGAAYYDFHLNRTACGPSAETSCVPNTPLLFGLYGSGHDRERFAADAELWITGGLVGTCIGLIGVAGGVAAVALGDGS